MMSSTPPPPSATVAWGSVGNSPTSPSSPDGFGFGPPSSSLPPISAGNNPSSSSGLPQMRSGSMSGAAGVQLATAAGLGGGLGAGGSSLDQVSFAGIGGRQRPLHTGWQQNVLAVGGGGAASGSSPRAGQRHDRSGHRAGSDTYGDQGHGLSLEERIDQKAPAPPIPSPSSFSSSQPSDAAATTTAVSSSSSSSSSASAGSSARAPATGDRPLPPPQKPQNSLPGDLAAGSLRWRQMPASAGPPLSSSSAATLSSSSSAALSGEGSVLAALRAAGFSEHGVPTGRPAGVVIDPRLADGRKSLRKRLTLRRRGAAGAGGGGGGGAGGGGAAGKHVCHIPEGRSSCACGASW